MFRRRTIRCAQDDFAYSRRRHQSGCHRRRRFRPFMRCRHFTHLLETVACTRFRCIFASQNRSSWRRRSDFGCLFRMITAMRASDRPAPLCCIAPNGPRNLKNCAPQLPRSELCRLSRLLFQPASQLSDMLVCFGNHFAHAHETVKMSGAVDVGNVIAGVFQPARIFFALVMQGIGAAG